MKFCPSCGAVLEEGAKFCQNCGRKVPVPEPVPEPIPEPIPEPVSEPAADSIPVYIPEEPLHAPAEAPAQPVQGFPEPPIQADAWDEPEAEPIVGSYEIPGQASAPPVEPPPSGGFDAPPPPPPGKPPRTPKAPKAPKAPRASGGKKRLSPAVLIFGAIALLIVILMIVLISMLFRGRKQPAPTPHVEPPSEAVVHEAVGCWDLLCVDSVDPDERITEDEVRDMRDMGLENFLILYEDGTGVLNPVYPTAVTWDDSCIYGTIEDETFAYNYMVDDGQLIVDLVEAEMFYVPRSGPAPEIDWDWNSPDEVLPDDGPCGWWDGDWYGWVVYYDTGGAYANLEDNYYAVLAEIDAEDDGTGEIELRDSTMDEDQYLGFADVSFGSGTTKYGAMVSERGSILGSPLGHADWIVDPGASIMSEFDRMLVLEGTVYDDGDEDSWIHYYIFLRPWGMKWEDVRTGDMTGKLYDNMMPWGYDDWYLPLLEAGIDDMPDTYQEGLDILGQ